MGNTVYKIITLSDTHGKHNEVDLPEGDLLVYAGDFTGIGSKYEVESFLKWLKKVSRKYTFGSVFIAGNHDRSFDPKYYKEYEYYSSLDQESPTKKPSWVYSMLEEYADPKLGVRYLEGTSVQIDKLKVWGSPYTPSFGKDFWAFNLDRGEEIYEHWKTIPTDVDILVTHGPSAGVLDYIPDQEVNVGCEDLKKVVDAIKPTLLVCGHIHESYGVMKSGSTIHLNSSICNKNYLPHNKPHSVIISK